MNDIRHDWQRDEIVALLEKPLMDLLFEAQAAHRQHNQENAVQLATLMSVKTGGCPENCSYCPQSAHYDTFVEKDPALAVGEVLWTAKKAKEAGASRFCMGWAWREVRDGGDFDAMIEMVKGVKDLGLEACVTAGMLNQEQADRLADAGLDAYNHNLDSSPEYYEKIISTRTYQDRLDTLACVRKSGVTLCSGGIIGMGESTQDRAGLLEVLANMDPHPESVPINALVAVEGTPLAEQEKIDPLDLVRMCATARILMPASRVRLSAGRKFLNREAQILCFMAGANSIFYGDELLTTGNNAMQEDLQMLKDIGARVLVPESADAATAPAPLSAG